MFNIYSGIALTLCISIISGCSQKQEPQTAAEYLRMGDQQLGRRHQQQARAYYQQLLEQFPASEQKPIAQFNIAESLYMEKNYLEARFEYQKFLELYPTHHLRRTYPQDPLIQEAASHIRFLRAHLAQHEFGVARFYYRKGAYHAAIGRLLNLIQVYPNMPTLDVALFMLADSYRAEENYVKAQRVLHLLINHFPTSAYLSRAQSQLRELPETGIVLQ
jgi:outer membrane protein assembly factor BamD